MLKRQTAALVAAGLIAAAVLAPATVVARHSDGADVALPRVVAMLPSGAFAESMAVDRSGAVFVTTTAWSSDGPSAGQVWKVTGGMTSPFGPRVDVGIFTGLVFDDAGYLYAGVMSWLDPTLDGVDSRILRYAPDGSVETVATLPTGDFGTVGMVNGLAYHGGFLYVGDVTGSIWRVRPRTGVDQVLEAPWLHDPLLEPAFDWLGVNGIAFRGNDLFALNYEAGTVLRIPLLHDGTAGEPTVFAEDQILVTADGLTVDADGCLWITVNYLGGGPGGGLLRVDRDGTIAPVSGDPAWLDYPTQAAFTPSHGANRTLYVLNGSLDQGAPALVALEGTRR